MERAAISYLNQHTRAVLDLVRKGHVVEITDRGEPIARIVPIEPRLSGVASRLVAEGKARPPLRQGGFVWADEPIDHTNSASRALADMRDEERY